MRTQWPSIFVMNKIWSKKGKWEKIVCVWKNCVEISLWWKNCDKDIWDKTHKLKFWQNSITQVVTKSSNSKCDETKKSNCDKTEKSDLGKTEKLKSWQNYKIRCWQNSNYDTNQRPRYWQNLKKLRFSSNWNANSERKKEKKSPEKIILHKKVL